MKLRMDSCSHLEYAEPYVLHQLSPEREEFFCAHLASCAACTEAVASADEYVLIFREAVLELDPLAVVKLM